MNQIHLVLNFICVLYSDELVHRHTQFNQNMSTPSTPARSTRALIGQLADPTANQQPHYNAHCILVKRRLARGPCFHKTIRLNSMSI